MSLIKKIGRVIGCLITVLIAVALFCNIYIIGVRQFKGNLQPSVFGWSWAVVISGSMEPEIQVNDIVIVHKEESYSIGDIITYESGESVITHRIIAVNEDSYITKGDYNNTADVSPVSKNCVIGKVACIIPGVGLFIQYLRTPLGMTCLVLIGFLLIEISYLLDKHKQEGGGG